MACTILRIRGRFVVMMCSTPGLRSVFESYAPLPENPMCPLCITAGSLYLASIGAGSAGGLAAVAAKVVRGRKRHKAGPSTEPKARPAPIRTS
jgi:hypothetical protein